MRIALCGTAFVRKARRGGMSNYFRQLIWHLAEIDQENEYTLLLHRDNAELFHIDQPNFRTVVVPMPGRQAHYWEQALVPFALRRLDLDLVHFVGFPAVLAQAKPTVVTAHDLTYKTRAETRGDRLSRFHWNFFGDRGTRRADHVITVSEHTRRDLEDLLGIAPERITVTYEAPASIFRPVEPEAVHAVTRGKYGIEGRYILFVGTLEPVKNLTRLVDAFALARDRSGIEPSLVVAGQKGWLSTDLYARIERLGLADQVVFTGYVPDSDLPALYSGADAFVLPSLYEGFGLPVLEAFACGTPVITSNVSSLPEIAENAALLVDPLSVEKIAAALERVCTDDYLRHNLRLAGLARAAQFSWKRCAEETRAVYRQVWSERIVRT
jgi:glycosyltransferase involved in cell wall biosynthesis